MSEGPRRLEIVLDDADGLHAAHEELSQGRIMAPGGAGVVAGDRCVVVVSHPATGREVSFEGMAVWVGADGGGVGVELDPLDPPTRRGLDIFVREAASGRPARRGAQRMGAANESIHQRLRGLSATDQARIAKSGNLSERTALERIYGKAVWDTLLRNPQITPPEVARIARMGALPLNLLERIVDNTGWLRQAPVRRALLSNPRLRGESLTKVLRATPAAELALMPSQRAYPPAVRAAAKRLHGGG